MTSQQAWLRLLTRHLLMLPAEYTMGRQWHHLGVLQLLWAGLQRRRRPCSSSWLAAGIWPWQLAGA